MSVTNEPTEAQVEAAAKAIADCHNPGMFEKYPENWRVEARAALVAAQGATPSVGIRALAEAEVRKSAAEGNPICEPGVTKDIAFIRGAVFGAAQGAAPQAGAYDHCCNHPKCPGGSLCCCISEQRQRDCWNQWREEVAGDTKQAFRDAYSAGRNEPAPWAAAPVLPSSPENPVQAFADWHERWWRNEPNTIAKANAQAAFFAGWDAAGRVLAGKEKSDAEH